MDRRTALKLLSASTAWALVGQARAGKPTGAVRAEASHGPLTLAFNDRLHCRVSHQGRVLTGFDASEALLLDGDVALTDFAFLDHKIDAITDPVHGAGTRHTLRGRSAQGVVKTLQLTLLARFPGFALLQVDYRNDGGKPLKIASWRNAAHRLADAPGGFWSYSGATHEDRRDWVQPVKDGFEQRNTLGMVASDYGGGTPVANLWRRDAGIAVGHVARVPLLLDMPVRKVTGGASIGLEGLVDGTLAPGESLQTPPTFIAVHTGDHFAPLTQYRQVMGDAGIAAPSAPASAFAPIWCAWGYERHFTREQVLQTLPKVRELGFEWAVLDDGWQTNEGDWALDRGKFPRGEADMRDFVAEIRKNGLKPRLWWAPLAVDPGSDLLHQHTDMLLLDRDGAVQKVSWWNAFTLCPAYQPSIDYHVALVKKFIGDWGYEGLKLDGQHLNAVAPCYNPAHEHARPEESIEQMGEFWAAIHKAAHDANADAVVELCPCGTSFAFHNIPATDQYPSSDPLSSWQVRSKGKSMKALMGRGSSYAGDHVELSDNRDDFASSVGIGAVISTKFTWPRDTDRPLDKLPPGGYVLTPEKEATWRKWVDLYKEAMLPTGDYLGDLYDIGFDRPEAHVIAKGEVLHYAFYADSWNGPVTLKGLRKARYRIVDPFNGRTVGTVTPRNATLPLRFQRFQLLRAIPIEDAA